ncbi:hypothetical protein SAMN02949497_4444 [Methylomagnum ishizawai]|uniref:Uncharacterized protein n=1 Tax=Methylomagnum ishizawai TaxID=1760988 RepID=A0A1Y6D260_9GAMM|nr:hypothetical protein [Methylomagnum ishizawai]SMF97028.1 hypothetical protein SAMN02949497_4444 [Methylomagnum ishizawai]
MTRVPRTVLFPLLVLMQLIAPWVHAHAFDPVGGGEGFLHLPGLEFLGRSGPERVALSVELDPGDWIVGMQAGVRHDSATTPAWIGDPDPAALAVAWPFPPPATWTDPPYLDAPPPLFHRPRRAAAHPRAPPAVPVEL